MDQGDTKPSIHKTRPDIGIECKEKLCSENVKCKRIRDLKWAKNRPDTPMVNEALKFEWRRTHSSDSTSTTNSSCPNSGSLCNSDVLEDILSIQKAETDKKLILPAIKSSTPNISNIETAKDDVNPSRDAGNNLIVKSRFISVFQDYNIPLGNLFLNYIMFQQ